VGHNPLTLRFALSPALFPFLSVVIERDRDEIFKFWSMPASNPRRPSSDVVETIEPTDVGKLTQPSEIDEQLLVDLDADDQSTLLAQGPLHARPAAPHYALGARGRTRGGTEAARRRYAHAGRDRRSAFPARLAGGNTPSSDISTRPTSIDDIRRPRGRTQLLAYTLLAFFWMKSHGASDALARTVAVNAITIGQAFYLLNSRYLLDWSFSIPTHMGNKYLPLAHRRGRDLQLLFTYAPPLFGNEIVPLWVWPWLLAGGLLFFAIVEAEKLVIRKSDALRKAVTAAEAAT
jgi:hypothetical protein